LNGVEIFVRYDAELDAFGYPKLEQFAAESLREGAAVLF